MVWWVAYKPIYPIFAIYTETEHGTEGFMQRLLPLALLLSVFILEACNKKAEKTDTTKQTMVDSARHFLENNYPNVKMDSAKFGEYELMQAYKDGEGFKEYWLYLEADVEQTITQEPSEQELLAFTKKLETGEATPDQMPQPTMDTVVNHYPKIKIKLDTTFRVKEVLIPQPKPDNTP